MAMNLFYAQHQVPDIIQVAHDLRLHFG